MSPQNIEKGMGASTISKSYRLYVKLGDTLNMSIVSLREVFSWLKCLRWQNFTCSVIGRSTVAQGRVTYGPVYRSEELAIYKSFKELLDSYSVNSPFTVEISCMILFSLRELLSTRYSLVFYPFSTIYEALGSIHSIAGNTIFF